MSADVVAYARSLLSILDSYGTDRKGPIPVGMLIRRLEDTIDEGDN